MSNTRPKKRARSTRNNVTVFYDDELDEGDAGRDVTISQTTTGRVLHSTSLTGSLEEDASDMMDAVTDPWTIGFFDANTEAFVVDPLPDDLQESESCSHEAAEESDEEIKQCKVVVVFYFRLLVC
jgi:hypothetical protein